MLLISTVVLIKHLFETDSGDQAVALLPGGGRWWTVDGDSGRTMAVRQISSAGTDTGSDCLPDPFTLCRSNWDLLLFVTHTMATQAKPAHIYRQLLREVSRSVSAIKQPLNTTKTLTSVKNSLHQKGQDNIE